MRRSCVLSICFLLSGVTASADTVIPGGSVSGVWTHAGSPYRITGEIVIPAGEILTIEPGVDVVFDDHYKFLVDGQLLAVGMASDSIRFSAGQPSVGWHGIRFENTPCESDSSLLVYCRLEHGLAEGDYPDYYGGALYGGDFEKIRIAHCTFRDNTAAKGGGVYCFAGGVVADCCFLANAATGSHGNPGHGSALVAGGNAAVLRNTIRENSSWDAGSTVALGGDALLQQNAICDNDGQGVALYSICTSRIVNNTISGNSSHGIGCQYGAAPQIAGCAICDNADSGLYFSLSYPTIINCTISGNTADHGGALFCSECDPIFINCILWGNSAVVGDQVYLHSYFQPSVNPDFHHCDIEGGVAAFEMYPGVSYEGRYEENIDCDPYFAGGAPHPYGLTPISYCVNAGRLDVDALGLPPTDLAGAPRIYEGFRVDLGAYEYQGTPAFADMPLYTPPAGWYPEEQVVVLSSPTPDVMIHYTLDGSEPSPGSPPYVDPLLIAAHKTIRAVAFHATLPPSLISSAAYRIGSDLAGPITGTLPAAYSPYYVIGDLEVPLGQSLTLEPGVEMRFLDHYRLDVQGQLLAVGTEAAGILFRADDPEVHWAGIRFHETAALNDSSRLEHCTILHGEATGSDPDDTGGGLYVRSFSKLAVLRCRFRSCSAVNGGGMACDRGASPSIVECIFEENSATRRGGGLYTGSECGPEVLGNLFYSNRANQGGGMCAWCSASADGPVRITGNEFFDNQATHGGSLIPAGGALYVYNGAAVIRGNLVSGNSSDQYGGGMHVERLEVEISDNIVTGNVCGGAGGGVACYVYSRGRMVNNLVFGNQAEGGGGVYLGHGDDWLLLNNTICDNSAPAGGGLLVNRGMARLIDCVLWGSTAPDGPQIAIFGGPSLEITFCDVQGGRPEIGGDPFQPYFTYENNIDDDPQFVTAGEWPYGLGEASPCIDAGIPDTTGLALPPSDLAGNPRIVAGRVDMGAYEYQGASAVAEGDGGPELPSDIAFALGSPCPNPLRSETQIAFAIPTRARVNLCVYDLTGRRVRTLINDVLPPGRARAVWNGRDERGHACAAGMYFARLSAGGRSASREVILLR